MLLATGVYALLCLKIPVRSAAPEPLLFRVIAMLAVGEVLLLFFFRRKLAVEVSAFPNAGEVTEPALVRWRTGYIITWAISTSIALYGVVLRFVGFEFRQVSMFFLAGAALMLFLGPRRPQPGP